MLRTDQGILISVVIVYISLIIAKKNNTISLISLSRFERTLFLDPFREMIEKWIIEAYDQYKTLLREQLFEYLVVLSIVILVIIGIFHLGNFILKCITITSLKLVLSLLFAAIRVPSFILRTLELIYNVGYFSYDFCKRSTESFFMAKVRSNYNRVTVEGIADEMRSDNSYFQVKNMKDLMFLDDNMNLCVPIVRNGKTYYKINKSYHVV